MFSGIQVGVVKNVKLIIDPNAGKAKVRVFMDIQPERVMQATQLPNTMSPDQVLQKMVNQGLRAQVGTVSYVTGQKDITLAWAAQTQRRQTRRRLPRRAMPW